MYVQIFFGDDMIDILMCSVKAVSMSSSQLHNFQRQFAELASMIFVDIYFERQKQASIGALEEI